MILITDNKYRHEVLVDEQTGKREAVDFLANLLAYVSQREKISPELEVAISKCVAESRKDGTFWFLFDM